MEPSALLSAAVALTIFAGTQWIALIRTRKTFLEGKLEELLNGFDSIAEKSVNFLYKLEYELDTFDPTQSDLRDETP